VVHDEHHRRLWIDLRQAFVVGESDAHPIQQAREPFRQPVANTKIDIGIEGRHDLMCIAQHFRLRHFAWHLVLGGVGLHRLKHFRVVGETIDQHLALGKLERTDADVKTGVDLVDHPIDAPAQKPARARHQHTLGQRPGGK
jgi:hypothetical protein